MPLINGISRFPTRKQVERANELRLQNLPGQEHTYMSIDRPGVDSDGKQVSSVRMATLLERMVATPSIKLKVCDPHLSGTSSANCCTFCMKVGAQVMLIKVRCVCTQVH